jgi:hypothetical protein
MVSRRSLLTAIGVTLTSAAATTGVGRSSSTNTLIWDTVFSDHDSGAFDSIGLVDETPLFVGRSERGDTTDGFAAKTDSSGNVDWDVRVQDFTFESVLARDTGAFLGGGTNVYSVSDGEVESVHNVTPIRAHGLARFPDDSFAVANTWDPPHAYQTQVGRYDPDSREVTWTKIYPDDLQQAFYFRHVRERDGGVGIWYTNPDDLRYYHVDVNGEITDEWSVPIRGDNLNIAIREDSTVALARDTEDGTLMVSQINDGVRERSLALSIPDDVPNDIRIADIATNGTEIIATGTTQPQDRDKTKIVQFELQLVKEEAAATQFEVGRDVSLNDSHVTADGHVLYAGTAAVDGDTGVPWCGATNTARQTPDTTFTLQDISSGTPSETRNTETRTETIRETTETHHTEATNENRTGSGIETSEVGVISAVGATAGAAALLKYVTGSD